MTTKPQSNSRKPPAMIFRWRKESALPLALALLASLALHAAFLGVVQLAPAREPVPPKPSPPVLYLSPAQSPAAARLLDKALLASPNAPSLHARQSLASSLAPLAHAFRLSAGMDAALPQLELPDPPPHPGQQSFPYLEWRGNWIPQTSQPPAPPSLPTPTASGSVLTIAAHAPSLKPLLPLPPSPAGISAPEGDLLKEHKFLVTISSDGATLQVVPLDSLASGVPQNLLVQWIRQIRWSPPGQTPASGIIALTWKPRPASAAPESPQSP